MSVFEKALIGLKKCTEYCCGECPYVEYSSHEYILKCENKLMKDLYEVLQEHGAYDQFCRKMVKENKKMKIREVTKEELSAITQADAKKKERLTKLKAILWENLQRNWTQFKVATLSLSQKEIFDRAYEITSKEEIYDCLSDLDLNREELETLEIICNEPNIIDVMYVVWMKMDDRTGTVWEDIDYILNDTVKWIKKGKKEKGEGEGEDDEMV